MFDFTDYIYVWNKYSPTHKMMILQSLIKEKYNSSFSEELMSQVCEGKIEIGLDKHLQLISLTN